MPCLSETAILLRDLCKPPTTAELQKNLRWLASKGIEVSPEQASRISSTLAGYGKVHWWDKHTAEAILDAVLGNLTEWKNR